MRIWLRLGACLISLLPAYSLAQTPKEDAYARVESSGLINDEHRITSLGGFGISDRKVGHFDLVYIDSDGDGDTLGVELGGGIAFRAGATFFLGAGLLLGLDTDDHVAATVYPEAGAVLKLGKSFGLIATGKHYVRLQGDSEDVVMLGLLYLIA